MEIVLSQFLTLTLVKPSSMISPSTPNLSTCIQSPLVNNRLAVIWIPATKPRIVSRNISNNTAAIAVKPDSSNSGLRSTISDTLSNISTINNISLATCTKPVIEACAAKGVELYQSSNVFSKALIDNAATVIRYSREHFSSTVYSRLSVVSSTWVLANMINAGVR